MYGFPNNCRSMAKSYEVAHYNLDMVLAAGCQCTASRAGVRFRQWAECPAEGECPLVKGIVLDGEQTPERGASQAVSFIE